MKLLFERSTPGRKSSLLPKPTTPVFSLPASCLRAQPPELPELAEVDIERHYTELAGQTYGVNNGFYPLGSCTMKYNPSLHEELAALPGFTGIHPLQPEETVQGCLEVMYQTTELLKAITGMDAMTLQPAAGAHGEYTGLLLIRSYHLHRGDTARNKIIIPDSAHGTNPASAVMAGFTVVNVPSDSNGCVDLDGLRAAVGPDTAGLMLTNPNTVGIFDPNILQITQIVHQAGGLCYYDGANLNAVMGIARPGDMGFDCIHLNLHKTFSTPHGGGGPGSGPVGCKDFLARFLPAPVVEKQGDLFRFVQPENSLGKVRSFYGNFLVCLRAMAYVMTLGSDGIPQAAEGAVLNANYLMKKLEYIGYQMAYPGSCMHEFVMDLDSLKKETGASAMEVAKRLLDYGIHPPTMYFPLIVHEALMVEPTETESKETLDQVAEIFSRILEEARADGSRLLHAPFSTPIGRPDEVTAARNPVLRCQK